MRYEIKELGVGGVLDQAISLVKNHFGLLLGITLCLYVPFMLVIGFVGHAITPVLPPNATQQEKFAAQQEALPKVLLILVPIAIVGGLIVMPLTNAAVIAAVASEYLEQPTTVGAAMRRAIR